MHSKTQLKAGGQHESRILAGYYGFNANIPFTRFKQSRISMLIPHIYVLGRFVNFLVINSFSQRISKIYGNGKF